MEIVQMHYFCMVARHRSMSRAAEDLLVSQSALSKAIGSLEEELGIKLFDRVGRRLTLSEAGRVYYERMCNILLRLNNAQKEMGDRYNHPVNEVRLIISAGNYIYNWLGEQYRKVFPDTLLYIRVSYDPDIYEFSQNDFHLFASPYRYTKRECLPLMEERLMLAMNQNHPLASQEEIRLSDTKDYWYQCLQPKENLRENLNHYCKQAGFTPKVGFSTNDSYTFFEALSGNDHLALLPQRTSPPSTLKNIVLKPIADPVCTRVLYLGWDKDSYISQCHKEFISFCQSFFTKENLELLLRNKQ
ncbi:LysR family transcriptional regulator [Ruminococcaceae bacterium OttesenSCG-928-I18]|nr:LysR family transcriptional regulator [Ruminococcaceae bacterium OttesenSCG-928-I18]